MIDHGLSSIESNASVGEIRAQEKESLMFLDRKKLHYALMELSWNEPGTRLGNAVIVSINLIDKDCNNSRRNGNSRLRLSIIIEISA